MRRPALFAAVLALSSCSYLTEAPAPSLPLDYRAAPYESVPTFVAEGGAGAIVVRDRYITGVCHSSEIQTATRQGSQVTLRIEHRRATGSEVCIDLGKLGAYQATIGGLEAGTYGLRVEYAGDIHSDTDPAALHATVTVR